MPASESSTGLDDVTINSFQKNVVDVADPNEICPTRVENLKNLEFRSLDELIEKIDKTIYNLPELPEEIFDSRTNMWYKPAQCRVYTSNDIIVLNRQYANEVMDELRIYHKKLSQDRIKICNKIKEKES